MDSLRSKLSFRAPYSGEILRILKRNRDKEINTGFLILPGLRSRAYTLIKKLSHIHIFCNQFSSVNQLCPTLCDPMNCKTPGFPINHQLPEFTEMSIESVMPSSHLILYRPLLLLPPIPPSIRVFSNESTLRMRWPKYWSLRRLGTIVYSSFTHDVWAHFLPSALETSSIIYVFFYSNHWL